MTMAASYTWQYCDCGHPDDDHRSAGPCRARDAYGYPCECRQFDDGRPASGGDMTDGTDIGHGHTISFTQWAPNRDLNPQYAGLPDVNPWGLIVDHPRPDGTPCIGSAATFDGPVVRQIDPDRPVWTVESLDPLTLSPSLLCRTCGDHGFIRGGKWIPA